MPEDDLSPEARAVSLLPPDPPAEPVRAIAERRVAGWATTVRLANRVARRPAGNSRRFWRKIEAEDPFLGPPSGPRLTDEPHAMYPLERAVRVESVPAQPRNPDPPRPRADAPPNKPKPSAPTPEDPVHTPDRRAVRAPQPPPRAAQPAPEPEPEPPPPVVDRRLPPKMPPPPPRPQPGSWTARNAAQQQQGAQRQQAPAPPPQTRQPAPPPKDPKAPPKGMSIDRALSILQELREAEEAAKRGEKLPEPPPPPRAVAPAQPRPAPAPQPRPAPAPARPAPAPARPAPPPARATSDDEGGADLPPPPRVSTQGKLDDIFGGNPNEGRVRIGAPKKKSLE